MARLCYGRRLRHVFLAAFGPRSSRPPSRHDDLPAAESGAFGRRPSLRHPRLCQPGSSRSRASAPQAAHSTWRSLNGTRERSGSSPLTMATPEGTEAELSAPCFAVQPPLRAGGPGLASAAKLAACGVADGGDDRRGNPIDLLVRERAVARLQTDLDRDRLPPCPDRFAGEDVEN